MSEGALEADDRSRDKEGSRQGDRGHREVLQAKGCRKQNTVKERAQGGKGEREWTETMQIGTFLPHKTSAQGRDHILPRVHDKYILS